VLDKCLVKMEKTYNLRVEDIYKNVLFWQWYIMPESIYLVSKAVYCNKGIVTQSHQEA
jgi:hypothetical protein